MRHLIARTLCSFTDNHMTDADTLSLRHLVEPATTVLCTRVIICIS